MLFEWSFTGWAVCRGSGAVEGFPWPGRPRGWTQLGGRSPGLRLAAAVLPAGKQRNVRCARSCVKARLLPLLRRSSRAALRCAALTPAPSAWASPRKQEEQKLQRPAAYRPGERRARFSPPPLRRPWEAQPPLRVAAAHSPQKNTLEEDFFVTPEATPEATPPLRRATRAKGNTMEQNQDTLWNECEDQDLDAHSKARVEELLEHRSSIHAA
jgi:hypothetical protein